METASNAVPKANRARLGRWNGQTGTNHCVGGRFGLNRAFRPGTMGFQDPTNIEFRPSCDRDGSRDARQEMK